MIPEYNIVTIGGRGFGKTALLGAMMRVPGFLPVVGAQSADDFNKGGLGGALEPTAVDAGIEKFEFECSDPNRFKLNFIDYAGELAQGYDNREESAGAKLGFASWKRRNIEKELRRAIQRADALMILLPANWEALDTELEALKGKIKRWINDLDAPRPIYVVVNKCDLMSTEKFDRIKGEKDVKDFVLSDPNCERIHSKIVEAVKVNESWGTQSVEQIHYVMISIYPRVDGGWVKEENQIKNLNEANASPLGLKDLVLEMVNNADEVRARNLMSAWNENAGSVKKWFRRFLKRMFYFPFKSRGLVRKGSVNVDLYKQMRGIWLSASWRIGVFSAAVATSVIGSWVFANWTQEAYSEYAFEKKLEDEASKLSLDTAERLIDYGEYFEDSTWVRPLFFRGNISRLKCKLEDLKTSYVEWLESDMTNQLADVRVAEMNCWEVDPGINFDRSNKRMQIITNHFVRIPKGCESAVIVNKKRSEETYRSHAEADKKFESALYALKDIDQHRKCREMALVKSSFAEKADSRKKDFVRLDKNISELECVLSNELDVTCQRIAKEVPGEAWKVRKARMQKQRESITNSLTWFIEGSATYKKWDAEAKRLAIQIAGNDHYGPFDVAFDKLKADRSNGQLIRFAEFEKEYPRVNYPERKDKFDELERLRKTVVADLTNRVAKAEKTHCDDPKLPMAVRIEKAHHRIGEYESVRKEFVTNGAEYVWASQKIEAERKWITDHQKYVAFEDNLKKNVETEQERECVKPLEHFLRDHTRGAYPEYADRIAELETRKEELNARLMAEVMSEIAARTNECAAATWQKQTNVLDRCQTIIAGYGNLVDMASREKLRKESKKLIALSGRLVRNGEFDDALASVTNASRRRLVKRIFGFREMFKAKDYQDRADAYALLHTMETNLVAQIAASNRAAVAALPKPKDRDFEGWRDRNQKVCEACNAALVYLPTNHVAAAGYVDGRNKAWQEVQKYTRWIEFTKEADRIVKDEKSELTVRLMNISAFSEKYKRDSDWSNPLLDSWYDKVGEIQERSENALAKIVEDELKRYQLKGKTADKEIQESIKRQIGCIDKNLRYFIVHSRMWNEYDARRRDLTVALGDEEKRQMFENDYKVLKQSIDQAMKANDKVDLINKFLSKYSGKEYSKFEHKLSSMKGQKEELKVKAKWDDLVAEVENGLKAMPQEGEDNYKSNMQAFRTKCQEWLDKVNSYGNQDRFAHHVVDIARKISVAIEEVNKRIGDGSWQEIVELEKIYSANPSDENYKDLTEALGGFNVARRGNERYAEKHQALHRSVIDDHALFEKLMQARSSFKENPSEVTFRKLKQEFKDYSLRGVYKERQILVPLEEFINMERICCDMRWKGHNISDTDFTKGNERDREHRLILEIKDNNAYNGNDGWEELAVIIGKFGNFCSDYANASYKIDAGNPSLRRKVMISKNGLLRVKLVATKRAPDQKGEGELDYWKLVSQSVSCFTLTVDINPIAPKGRGWLGSLEHPNTPAKIYLEFSNVPVCP